MNEFFKLNNLMKDENFFAHLKREEDAINLAVNGYVDEGGLDDRDSISDSIRGEELDEQRREDYRYQVESHFYPAEGNVY